MCIHRVNTTWSIKVCVPHKPSLRKYLYLKLSSVCKWTLYKDLGRHFGWTFFSGLWYLWESRNHMKLSYWDHENCQLIQLKRSFTSMVSNLSGEVSGCSFRQLLILFFCVPLFAQIHRTMWHSPLCPGSFGAQVIWELENKTKALVVEKIRPQTWAQMTLKSWPIGDATESPFAAPKGFFLDAPTKVTAGS